MGRLEPTVVLPPQSTRRDARSKAAKTTLNKTVPALLTSSPRARRGVDSAELIVDPGPVPASAHLPAPPPAASSAKQSKKSRPPSQSSADANGGSNGNSSDGTAAPLRIRLQVADSLDAARRLHTTNATPRPGAKHRNVALLNMASPLRPGGGFLNGAASQEERLCMRTTLLAALREEWYRLPEVGGVWAGDVLVFRGPEEAGGEELWAKRDWFFVDVLSAGMLRFPDVEGRAEEGDERVYASARDRELVLRKMRAAMRILRMKGAEKVVLGAWGCGAYGNPVGEIARAWRKVLLGANSTRRKGKSKGGTASASSGGEGWEGMDVVFAIRDRRMADEFARFFGSGLEIEEVGDGERDKGRAEEDDGSNGAVKEMRAKVAEMEEQMMQARNPDLKARMEIILKGLKAQLPELTDGSDDSGERLEGDGQDGDVDSSEEEEGESDQYEGSGGEETV